MSRRLCGLAAQAVAGDRRAADALLSEVVPEVARIVRYRLRGRTEVESWTEDVVQIAVARIWRGLPQVEAGRDDELIGWVRAVTRREIAGWMRTDLPVIHRTCHLDQAWIEPDEAPRRLENLRHAYGSLSDPAQELLYMRLVERLAWSEIGEEFGISATAARRRGQRAIASLRRCLDEMPSDRKESASSVEAVVPDRVPP